MWFFRRIPAIFLNGFAVAVGIGCIQLAIGGWGGSQAAQLALSGAVCTSLADVPGTVSRTWHRVPAAAALSFLAALTVGVLKPYPVALGIAIALIAFIAMMTMAWGPRAGAVSFAPIMSLVFAMAMPTGSEPLAALAGWNAAGGAAYLLWSLMVGGWLQERYRALALSNAISAAAALLRARAALLKLAPSDTEHAGAMQVWVQGEADLADRLQTARDFIFVQGDGDAARRETAILLSAIDLRDVLLASRLDLELLGNDATGRWLLQQLGDALRGIAAALDSASAAQREGIAPAPLPGFDFAVLFRRAPLAGDDSRARLIPALEFRLHSLASDATRIHALLHGAQEDDPPLTREQLRRFVAPEGWPWPALRAHLRWSSPVLRHALRSALALGSAYFIALALPWASHPHWLVLSVAVVLRGSLEQTLSRRNARVLGTLLGCAVVVALSGTRSAFALGVVFLVSVGIAHAFVLQRYWLTATAATVMALLQSHLADPGAGFAIGERVADTLLGAALAWSFSYVLPSWERRGLPGAIARVLKEVADYGSHALQRQAPDAVEQRLARRRAYEALSAVAAVLQRGAAEPLSVRPPMQALAALLDHGQRLMAHLSVVRMTLSQAAAEVKSAEALNALAQARVGLVRSLDLRQPMQAVALADLADDLTLLPQDSPAEDAMPWLLRRLQLLLQEAGQIRLAAAAAMTAREPRAGKPGDFGQA
jgi:uncharacterized membrane protein YccC